MGDSPRLSDLLANVNLIAIADRIIPGGPTSKSAGSGKVHKYRCPNKAHRDSDPSFAVYNTGSFYCFGCGISGRLPDLLDLLGIINLHADNWKTDLMAFLGQDIPTEYKNLALDTESKEALSAPKIRQDLAHFYATQINLGKGYLRSRGLYPLPDKYRLGVKVVHFKQPVPHGYDIPYISVPHIWHDRVWGIKLRRNDIFLKEKPPQFSPGELSEMGFLKGVKYTLEQTLKMYEVFYPRYMAETGSSFGIYNADILDNSLPLLLTVEGEFDALLLNKMGYAAIALKPKGESFNGRLSHLLRNAERVVTIADNDERGLEYAKALQACLGGKCVISVPPIGKDVTDAVVRYGYTTWLKELTYETA